MIRLRLQKAVTFLLSSLLCTGTMVAANLFSAYIPSAKAEQQPAETASLGNEIGIIDQIVNISFEPITLFVLQESGLGTVRQYEAAAAELTTSMEDGAEIKQLIVGAPVPVRAKNLRDDSFHFTFFLASRDSGFAATEVKKWSKPELQENSANLATLKQNIAEVKEDLKKKRVKTSNLDEKLQLLREKTSKIAEVDEIVKIKQKIAALEAVSKKKSATAEQLRILIDEGRVLEDPEGIDKYRQRLSVHLREAAKVTAVADRLNQRKREAALQKFMKKIKLVKEMDEIDPEILAKEILLLRKKRRELENRLGITSSDSYSDEF